MELKQQAVEKSLKAKGFVQEDGHHRYFVYYTIDGLKSSISTRTSHGNRDLNGYLISNMARQVKLSKDQFLDLVRCPLGRDDYERLLREGDHL